MPSSVSGMPVESSGSTNAAADGSSAHARPPSGADATRGGRRTAGRPRAANCSRDRREAAPADAPTPPRPPRAESRASSSVAATPALVMPLSKRSTQIQPPSKTWCMAASSGGIRRCPLRRVQVRPAAHAGEVREQRLASAAASERPTATPAPGRKPRGPVASTTRRARRHAPLAAHQADVVPPRSTRSTVTSDQCTQRPSACASRTRNASKSARSQCVSATSSHGLAATSSSSRSPHARRTAGRPVGVETEAALEAAADLRVRALPLPYSANGTRGRSARTAQLLEQQVGQRRGRLPDREAWMCPPLQQADGPSEPPAIIAVSAPPKPEPMIATSSVARHAAPLSRRLARTQRTSRQATPASGSLPSRVASRGTRRAGENPGRSHRSAKTRPRPRATPSAAPPRERERRRREVPRRGERVQRAVARAGRDQRDAPRPRRTRSRASGIAHSSPSLRRQNGGRQDERAQGDRRPAQERRARAKSSSVIRLLSRGSTSGWTVSSPIATSSSAAAAPELAGSARRPARDGTRR